MALVGFTGPPDAELLEKLSATLSHRGSVRETRGGMRFSAVRRGVDSLAGPGSPSAELLLDGFAYPAVTDPGLRIPDSGGRPPGAFLLVHERSDGGIELTRDGAGLRTGYWTRWRERVVFSSEPKSFLALPGFSPKLRPEAVAEYLTFSFIPGSATMLEGVYELLPGESLIVAPDGGTKQERWFDFEAEERETPLDEGEALRRYHGIMDRCLEPLENKGTIAVFLSGGLDSSLVTAEAAKRGLPLRTWSIHFGKRYPNELEYARTVAERLKTAHEEVEVRPRDFLPRLQEIIWRLDEPIGDPITVPNHELASRAARETGLQLNGEGGDPLFGGPKNIPMLLQHWYGVPREDGWRERAYLASYRRAYDDLGQLLSPDFLTAEQAEEHLRSILQPFFYAERPRRFLNKLCAINIRLKGAHLILPKVERMTSAHGLTAFSPLFDQELIRLSFAMDPRLKLSGGVEKGLLKKAAKGLLPPEVIHRPKSGMRVPVHYWFRGEMRRFARKVLSRRELDRAGIFHSDRVRQYLGYDIEEAGGRYGLRLWMLVCFELWRRAIFEGEAP